MLSPFSSLRMAAQDPILGLNELFKLEKNQNKVNLGIGVYTGEDGRIPLLASVAAAEKKITESPAPWAYLPIDGITSFDLATQRIVFGTDHSAIADHRIMTVQALGGTGGIKIGADFLKHVNSEALVLISDPSWENHRAIFENAGFMVDSYPYYSEFDKSINLQGMLARFSSASPGTIVVLHACCHNPTGYDLSDAEWNKVVEICRERNLLPFIDMAYQGFANGLLEDRFVVQKFLNAGLYFLVANSFSKSFSLYGERVGALSIATASEEESVKVLSQVKRFVRSNYSSPPTHGAQVVSTILNSPDLTLLWEDELRGMRSRIKVMREALANELKSITGSDVFNHIRHQQGMFSYSGLSGEQMRVLREAYGVYGLASGRICVAALNSKNVGYVAKSIAAVL